MAGKNVGNAFGGKAVAEGAEGPGHGLPGAFVGQKPAGFGSDADPSDPDQTGDASGDGFHPLG